MINGRHVTSPSNYYRFFCRVFLFFFSFLYEPVLNIDTLEAVVISHQCTDDQRFGIPKKLLNNCIPNARFILLSSRVTIAIAVVVGAVYHSYTTFSKIRKIRFLSESYLLKQIWRKNLNRANEIPEFTLLRPSNP